MDEENVEFTLLANGLDFIWSAVENLGTASSKRELKYAVLHLCSGIELVLKERLRLEYWSLVFQDPSKADRRQYEAGRFFSVKFKDCIDRLRDDCGVDISDQERQELLSFRDKRNRMEHFDVVDTADAITAASTVGLSFLVDFINSELYPEDLEEEEAELLKSIRRKLGEFKAFVENRWAVIEEILEQTQTAIVTCPRCRQDASVLDDGATCLFCGYQAADEEAADSYIFELLGMDYHTTVKRGGEWPRYECPSCLQNTLVNTAEVGGQFPAREFVCFRCGEVWMEGTLEHCQRCARLYAPREGGMEICSECFDSIIKAED